MIKRIDVEQLLRWAYGHELNKRGAQPWSSPWKALARFAQLRQWVDDTPQLCGFLPAVLGEPHKDALAVAQTVACLHKRPQNLLIIHASSGTRPDWLPGPVRVLRINDEDGKRAKIIGECRGRNYYTSGSYCPLRFEPSVAEVAAARAAYALWHYALGVVVRDLSGRLAEHEAVLPRAAAEPWITGENDGRVLYAA